MPINDGLMSDASKQGGPTGPSLAQNEHVQPHAFGKDPYDVPESDGDELNSSD